MTYLSQREINNMGLEAMQTRLRELEEEMLQLRAQKSLGGSTSNMGAFKATRRSLARLKTALYLVDDVRGGA
jgi:ribosomal protein L29